MYERGGFSQHKYDYLYVVETHALSQMKKLRNKDDYFEYDTTLYSESLGSVIRRCCPNKNSKLLLLSDDRLNKPGFGLETGSLIIVIPKNSSIKQFEEPLIDSLKRR